MTKVGSMQYVLHYEISSQPLSNRAAQFSKVSKGEMLLTENMIANREQKRQGTHFEPEMHLWPNSHEINPASQPHPELFESSQIQESLRGNGMTATCYARNAATGCQRQSIKDHPNK